MLIRSAQSYNEDEAKRLAAGPLGQLLAEYPMLFANAVFFGEHPMARGDSREIYSATVTLLKLACGSVAVTCFHVLAKYREVLRSNNRALFQIGNCKFDPLPQLISESAALDLAVIALTRNQVAEITKEEKIGSCVFAPAQWPPPHPKEGDAVAFGGFPGALRKRDSIFAVEFGSFSIGSCFVASTAPDRFACQFEREYWVNSFGLKEHFELTDLRGMSGGPAFIHRGLHWELIGFIYEFSSAFDIMFLRPANLIGSQGAIDETQR